MVSFVLSVKKTGQLLSLVALAALGSCGQHVAAPVAAVALEARPVAAPLPVHRLAAKMSASIDSTEAALEAGWASAGPALPKTAPSASPRPAPASLRTPARPQPRQAVLRAARPGAASPVGA